MKKLKNRTFCQIEIAKQQTMIFKVKEDMGNFLQNLKNLKNLMTNFDEIVNIVNIAMSNFKAMMGIRYAEAAQMDGQQPTNIQRISNLSLTLGSLRGVRNSCPILSRLCLVSLILMTVGIGQAWGWTSGTGSLNDGVYYSYYNVPSKKITVNNNVISLNAPAKSIDVRLSRDWGGLVSQNVTLYYSTNTSGDSWTELHEWTDIDYNEGGFSYNSIPKEARRLKFSASGGTKTKYIHSIKVKMADPYVTPSASSIDFGSSEVGASDTERTFTFFWNNNATSDKTLTITTDGANVSLSAASVTATAGSYGTTSTIKVTYTHGEASSLSEKKIYIKEGSTTRATITLSGSTTRKEATMGWNEETDFMNPGDEFDAAAWSSDNTRPIKYSTSNSAAIKINEDGLLEAVAAGSATITAYQDQDNTWAYGYIQKTITVTNKQKQTITWTDKLSYKYTGSNVTATMTATASSGLAMTYSVNPEAASWITISGSTLTIKGKGTAYITASPVSSDDYVAVSQTRKLVSRDPSESCEPLVLENGEFSMALLGQKELSITGFANQLTFKAYKTMSTAVGDMLVEQKVGDDWSEIVSIGVGSLNKNSYKSFGPYPLNRNASAVRFTNNGSYTRYVDEVEVTMASFLETSVNSLNFEAQAGARKSTTFTVDYSKIQAPLSITSSDESYIEVSPEELGEDCGDYGTNKVVTVIFKAAGSGSISGKNVTITDGKNLTKVIPVTATVTKNSQQITWHNNTTFQTTDSIALIATASSLLPITSYTSKDTEIAKISAENNLWFLKSGEVDIDVYQEGNDSYDETTKTQRIVVNKVTPAIVTKPTVATIKYLDNLNDNQLSEGLATVTLRGVANTTVEGAFEWTETPQVVAANGAGNYDYSVTFKPSNTGMYNDTTFSQSIAISRAAASIVMNDGSVNVMIDTINQSLDETKLDLDDLITSQTVDNIAASRAGAVSYKVLSDNAEYASIDANHVFVATRCGAYTIEATKAQTNWYEGAKDTFVVTVNKLNPTVVFDNTDDPQVLYTLDILTQPAARYYNGHEIDRVLVYVSENQSVLQANNKAQQLKALEVKVNEGESVAVTVNAYSVDDDFFNQSESTEKHYAIYAKRSPHFTMDGQTDTPVSKTLNIGETATITYNEFTSASFAVTTSGEHGYVTYTNDAENRIITVTAVKGNLSGDGEQVITLTQPGTDRLYQRQVDYTFTVQRNVSTLSLEPLVTNMYVEDTVTAIYTGLANTVDEIQFSCVPEESMKYEDGKLIALQAGTNTVTFTQPNTEYWTGITQSKTITVSKINPQITWFEETRLPWYATIRHPFTSTNTMEDCPVSVVSGNEALAKYIAQDNKIVVYGTDGTVTFTLNQPGNYKYNPVVNAQKTFTIFKPENGLPFTLSSGNWTNYKNSNQGSISWDNGILCGKTGAALNWGDKYVVLHFTGIPDTLSFDFKNSSVIATQYGWHFYQSSTGDDNDWHILKEYADQLMNSDGGTSEGSEKLALNPDTRFLKLEYHGNYGGYFRNVSVTERKEITPQRATEDFGLGFNGNEPSEHTLPVDWYNVNSCRVYIDGDDADRFILTENTIYSNLNEYATANLHVSYKHDVNTTGTHTATLHIVEELPNGNDGLRAEIALVGQTTPAPQLIIWREDLTPMPSVGEFTGAAYSTSGLAVTLTSLNTEYVTVGGEDGLTLYPVAAGIAKVVAYQAGDDKWAEVVDTLEIEVTTKQVQFITWNDNLSNLKREDGKTVTVTLTATASSELDVVYSLDEAASEFASISGNVLTLTGWGTGTITAVQEGNNEYVAVRKKKTLVSRNPNAGCRPLVGEYSDEYTLHTIAFKEIELTGEPATVEFDAKCDATALNGLLVAEYYDNYWHEIARIKRLEGNTITSSYKHFGPYNLNRNSTAVKIYTETGATMTRTFKNVEVTMAKYLELDRNEMNFTQLDKGATKIQSFYINYSNITGVLDVALDHPSSQFEVMTTTVGKDCGDAGKSVRIDIKCTGKTAGTEENEIIVSNFDQSLRIPVTATVVLPSQTITWNPELTERNILTTDNIELNAAATSGLAVTFESNSVETADVVKNAGVYSLDIKKYGDVTITAKQAGNDDWSAATDKPVIFHISRVVPVITEPTTEPVLSSLPLSDCALLNGAVEGNIPGEFRWVNPEQVITRENHTYQAMFLPENTNYYEPVVFDVTLDVIEDTQSITWSMAEQMNAFCADVVVFDAVASSGLPVTYISSDSLVAYVVNDTLKVIKSGPVTITATQAGDNHYSAAMPVSTQINLTRNSLTVVVPPTVSSAFVDHSLSGAAFIDGGVVKAGEIVVSGKYNWEEDVMLTSTGHFSYTAIFTPDNTFWYEPTSCNVMVEVISAYVFTGEGGWEDVATLWQDERQPDGGGNDDVVITGALTITETDVVEVRDLNVTGELKLDEGASVTVTGDLIIEATLGGMDEDENVYAATSGQLTGNVSDSVKVHGDVYFQMSFDPTGKISYGWYDFTVPFTVNVNGGISRIGTTDDRVMVSGTDFMIMEADEANRANGGRGWRNVSTNNILQPGRLYTITFNYRSTFDQNTFLFKWNGQGTLQNGETSDIQFTSTATNAHSGWNGLGNGMLCHGSLGESYTKQMFNHAQNAYEVIDGNVSFAVGSAFFVQVPEESASVINWNPETSGALHIQSREGRVIDKFCLKLYKEGKQNAADLLYVSANEEATDTYRIGHDVQKMGTMTESKVARMWTNKEGRQLCDIEAALVNSKATTPLYIYAPQDGQFTLNVERAPEDATLYLTYNNRAIWNLTMSPYEFDLTKGTTEGYGLRIVASPQTTTDLENDGLMNGANGVRKVIIDNVIYLITPEGQMYDIVGKGVKF